MKTGLPGPPALILTSGVLAGGVAGGWTPKGSPRPLESLLEGVSLFAAAVSLEEPSPVIVAELPPS